MTGHSFFRKVVFWVASLPLVFSLLACGQTTGDQPGTSSSDPEGRVAGSPLAILTSISGTVQVRAPGASAWTEGKVSMTLGAGVIVKTEPAAGATITFFEGSTVELGESTEVNLSDLAAGDGTASSIRLKQEIGQTISRVKKLIDPASRYEVETTAAVAAVRGTTMLVDVAADGTTVVGNIEGLVSVIAQDVEVRLPAGTHSTIVAGQPPGQPQPGAAPPPTTGPATTPPASTTATAAPITPPVTGAGTIKPGGPPGPISYSALNDFTVENGNPNGSWSYGWMPTDFSTFNIYNSHDFSVFGKATRDSFSWYANLGVDRTPCIWVNEGNTAYGAPAGWLSLHPGPGKEPSVIRWTAPAAGNIRVLGEFLPGDRGSMAVAIRHNSREIWSATDSGKFDLLANAAAGDIIDFMVYGGYNYGNTPVSVIVSYGD